MNSFFERIMNLAQDSVPTKVLLNLLLCVVIIVIIKLLFKVKCFRSQRIHIKFLINMTTFVVGLIFLIRIIMLFNGFEQFGLTLAASSSLLVVVLGFAAQEALSNILNGIMISVLRPFEIGDRVHIVSKDITGEVEDITIRHTVIKTVTNTRLIIPNSVINKEILENSNYTDSRNGNFLDVLITYESNIQKAIELMSREIELHPLVIDMRGDLEKSLDKPPVSIFVPSLDTHGVLLRATVWANTVGDNFKACSDLRLRIKEVFEENDIDIAYPHLTIVNKNK